MARLATFSGVSRFSKPLSHGSGHSPGISLLLFSHRVQPPHSLHAAKSRSLPALPSLPEPFSQHLRLQWHSAPGLSSRRAAAAPDPPWVPAPGSVPPLGRYGTLEPTTSSTETVPGVVYWPGSSTLSLHNYGVSTQERGEKKPKTFAALACYGLKLQLFA